MSLENDRPLPLPDEKDFVISSNTTSISEENVSLEEGSHSIMGTDIVVIYVPDKGYVLL